MTMIYKICPATIWQQAETAGFCWSRIDLADGYIHFSAGQVAETARLHFASQPDLVLVEVDSTAVELSGKNHVVANCFRISITDCHCRRLFQFGRLRWLLTARISYRRIFRRLASATRNSSRAASRLALVVGESLAGAP